MYKFVSKKTALVVFMIDIVGSMLFIILSIMMPWRLRRINKVPKHPRNILVIRADYIGDVILALPAVQQLKQRYPKARITFVVSSMAQDILKDSPFIDDVIVYDPPWFFKKDLKEAFKEYLNVLGEIRKQKCKLALELRGDIRNIMFLMCLTMIPYRIGFASSGGWYLLTKVVPYPPGRHEANYHMEVVRATGARAEGTSLPRISITSEEKKFAEDFLKNNGVKGSDVLVAIHPGARQKPRLWPVERYAKVAAGILEKYNAKFIITGSAGEIELAEKLAKLVDGAAIVGAGKILSLKHLASVLKHCSLYIGCSTGPSHLAAAMGTPTVLIFGPESSERWHPLGENHVILKKDVPCSPCIGRGEICLHPESQCIMQVTSEDMLAAVIGQLERLNIPLAECHGL